jgi:hypothetical protein
MDQPLQPIIDIEKPWLPPHAFPPNPSNPMESEKQPIDWVFRTVRVRQRWSLVATIHLSVGRQYHLLPPHKRLPIREAPA